MITLYNVGCKFPVKEMEKSELRLLVIEDEKKLCDMIAKVCTWQVMRWICVMMESEHWI